MNSAFGVGQLPQVEVQEHNNQNHEYHPSLKYFGIQSIVLDLLVGIHIAQALCFVEHDLVDLFVELLVVSVIAPHGDTPHDQP